MEFYIMLIAGAVAGGFVNGLAGFGTGLIALGFFLAVMTPIQAVAIIIIMSLFAGGLGIFTVRDAIAPNKFAILRLTLPGLLAVPLGVWALSYVSAKLLSALVAVLLLLYGGYFLARKTLPLITSSHPVLDALIGLIGGFLGGLAALSGAIPTMYYAMRDLSKQDTRTILQCYNLSLLSLAFVMLVVKGAYQGQTMLMGLLAIPFATLSAHIGLRLFKRLSTDSFRRLLIILTFLSGVVMMVRILS